MVVGGGGRVGGARRVRVCEEGFVAGDSVRRGRVGGCGGTAVGDGGGGAW